MKIVQLHEQTLKQCLNPSQTPKIAHQDKKRGKNVPKIKSKSKVEIEEKIEIISIHKFLPPWTDYGYNIYIVSFGRYTNSKLLRFFTHNICAGDTKRLTSLKLFWFTIHHKSHNNIYAVVRGGFSFVGALDSTKCLFFLVRAASSDNCDQFHSINLFQLSQFGVKCLTIRG